MGVCHARLLRAAYKKGQSHPPTGLTLTGALFVPSSYVCVGCVCLPLGLRVLLVDGAVGDRFPIEITVVPDVAGGLTEDKVQAKAFELVFAFDEVITTGGHKESITLQQASTLL